MAPKSPSDIDALVEEARGQAGEVAALLGGLSDEAAHWRPDPTRWSVAGHVAHLAIINDAYLSAIASAVDRATSEGVRSEGPYRHPRIASWFARSMEPPPKRRLKTLRSMVPDPGVGPSEAGGDFARLQEKLIDLMEDARGLDLGRVRFGSPFLALLRFSLGTAFEMLLAHNRRHVWLAREVIGAPSFPDDGVNTGGADRAPDATS